MFPQLEFYCRATLFSSILLALSHMVEWGGRLPARLDVFIYWFSQSSPPAKIRWNIHQSLRGLHYSLYNQVCYTTQLFCIWWFSMKGLGTLIWDRHRARPCLKSNGAYWTAIQALPSEYLYGSNPCASRDGSKLSKTEHRVLRVFLC